MSDEPPTEPVVTTIIPTYRRPASLARAIRSVLHQTYPHVRVLVCDNASGDETESVVAGIARADGRVRYHRHPENLGMFANFQFGLDAVDTEYFLLLSDDDFLLPGQFRRAIDAFAQHPEAKFYCAQTIVYDEAEGTHSLRPRKRWEPGIQEAGRWTTLMFEQFPVWTSCVFASEIRAAMGPLERIPQLDVAFLGRAAAMYPFIVDYTPGAVFSLGSTNMSRGYTAAQIREYRAVMHRVADDLPGVDAADRTRIHEIVDDMFGVEAHGLLRQALVTGNRDRFEDIVTAVRDWKGFTPRRRLRVAMARAGAAGFRIVGGVTHWTDLYKKRRRSGWKTMSLEEIVARYSEEASS